METLTEAQTHLTKVFIDGCREAGSITPSEFDSRCNDGSRRVVEAMLHANGGECWLGKVNRYKSEDDFTKSPVWKHTGAEKLYNFGASFVMPKFSEEVERLLLERERAEYTSATDDYTRITAIYEAVKKAGGVHLHWT